MLLNVITNLLKNAQLRMKNTINSEKFVPRHIKISREILQNMSNRYKAISENPLVAVGIATSGRAAILSEMVKDLKKQTVKPYRIVISYSKPSDIEGIDLDGVELLQGKQGLTAQRNAILDNARDADIIQFFDDDFFPKNDFLEQVANAFRADSNVVGVTGQVIADGAKGPGLTVSFARTQLISNQFDASDSQKEDVFNTYGCNMAFRISALEISKIRFDEKLPLYGWYEDMDFSRRLLPYGRLIKVKTAIGVHLGSKAGKSPGCRLGYSQVVNSFYLAHKGSYPWDHAFRSAGRHVLINALRSAKPEQWVDRRGRLKGNLIGLWDVIRGRLTPERASQF
ncbi:hypothetical protein A0U89_04830 [Kozakia baliensis]|uniref:Glycosyltransferase 2-like domain-containing protein n=2 Tax=Kozakia baliensis TaxID=153496 RepID=A0A1D8USF2_9PROT|nr:hypothetical protein A0U89_04830 [Kozakia baliensis]